MRNLKTRTKNRGVTNPDPYKKYPVATVANMEKHQRPGLIMFSPYTGEEASATPGDYWDVSSSYKFKDRTGRVMRLGVPSRKMGTPNPRRSVRRY